MGGHHPTVTNTRGGRRSAGRRDRPARPAADPGGRDRDRPGHLPAHHGQPDTSPSFIVVGSGQRPNRQRGGGGAPTCANKDRFVGMPVSPRRFRYRMESPP